VTCSWGPWVNNLAAFNAPAWDTDDKSQQNLFKCSHFGMLGFFVNSLGLIYCRLLTSMTHGGSNLEVRSRSDTTAPSKKANTNSKAIAKNITPKKDSLQIPSIELTPMQRALQEFYYSFA
jgi:hypothetical protein